MDNPQFTLHSGGAHGADRAWALLGKESGLPLTVKHWTPTDLEEMSPLHSSLMHQSLDHAAKTLGRPRIFNGMTYVQRNWFQAYHCEALYAISTIIPVGGLDKGFVNTSGKEVVAGGTGWTVEMAIQMGKPVYVFDQHLELWMQWYSPQQMFLAVDYDNPTPTLTPSFAGVGSRNLLPSGIQAIKDVYQKTLEHGKDQESI